MDDEEYTILIVDDEDMVTTSLSTLFILETGHNILTYNSPSDALVLLQTEKVDLVISDYLMPGDMNGVEFLLELKKIQPETIRILLTAYADKENAIRAINEVGLYQYIEKPWDNDSLLLLTRNGLRHGRLLKQLTEKTRELSIAKENLERVQTEILKAFV